MAAPLFTLTAGDGLAARIGVTREALAGAKLVLRSNIKRGEMVVIDGGLELVDDVPVTLDEDGKINGDTGVQLLADDPSLGLENSLQWQINIKNARSQGFSKSVTSWWINAGSTGSTVSLDDQAKVPGQVAAGTSRGPRGYSVDAVSLDGEELVSYIQGVEVGRVDLAGVVPGALWSTLGGKPSVIAGGSTAAVARNTVDAWGPHRRQIRRSRPGVVRRVLAPGNVSWLNSHIRVFFDGHKFFTDFDVTTKRHTGTKRYTDRENGASGNSGLSVTLTAALVAGTAVTSFAVSAVPSGGFPNGSKVVVFAQDSAGVWRSMVATLAAAALASDTTLTVSSVTPAFSFPVGSTVANPVNNVQVAYTAAVSGDQIIPLDRVSNSFGGVIDRSGGWGFAGMQLSTRGTTTSALSTGSPITSIPITALASSIAAGQTVTLNTSDNQHFQQFTLTATASAGATSLTVASQTPNYAFPSGTTVRSGNRIAKSLTIAPQFPGEVKLVTGDWHTWALKATYTNVYTVTRSNTRRVVDSGVGEYGMEYTLVADAAACEALPGSYYISGSEVGVHYIKGGSPDPKRVHVLISEESFTVRNENGDMSIYLAGFSVYGGSQGVWCENVPGGNLDVYAHRMNFLYCVSTDANTSNALNISGCRYVFLQECKAAFGPKDGFSYHQFNRDSVYLNATRFIEVDCEAWALGIGNTITGAVDTNNGSTAHEGAQGIRIGGSYHETSGAPVADVHADTETWNVECDVWKSVAVNSTYKVALSAQQTGTILHVWNCRTFDGDTLDIEARAGTTVNVFNSEYDSLGGSGTINVVASV